MRQAGGFNESGVEVSAVYDPNARARPGREDTTTPVSVRFDEVAVGPIRQLSFDNPQFALIRGTAAFAIVEDGRTLIVRLEYSLRIAANGDDGDSSTTTITTVHLAAFDCHKDLETWPNALSAWIETNV
jgi:hypothetical protein